MLVSCNKQRSCLIRRHNADASRPPDELGVRPSVVVAPGPSGSSTVLAKSSEMPAHNGQLAGFCVALPAVSTKTHFTSCIPSEAMGMFQHERFGGNTSQGHELGLSRSSASPSSS